MIGEVRFGSGLRAPAVGRPKKHVLKLMLIEADRMEAQLLAEGLGRIGRPAVTLLSVRSAEEAVEILAGSCQCGTPDAVPISYGTSVSGPLSLQEFRGDRRFASL